MSDGLKPKDELLKEVFDHVRKEGRVPWINDEDGDEDNITVDEICIHGKSLDSKHLFKDEESDLWTWESNGESDEFCFDCQPDCDCGHPHERHCPICESPWPKFSEERLIEAWKNDEDLVLDTNCPKCGHAWALTTEEMKKLHPEVLAQLENGEKGEGEKDCKEAAPEAGLSRDCSECKVPMIYGGPRVFTESKISAMEMLSMEPGECRECPPGTRHGSRLNGDGSIRTSWFCEKCEKQQDVTVDFETWWKFSRDDADGEDYDTNLLPSEDVHKAEAWKPAQRRPMRNGRPIGRNSECPCGSGKKYKRCCEGKR